MHGTRSVDALSYWRNVLAILVLLATKVALDRPFFSRNTYAPGVFSVHICVPPRAHPPRPHLIPFRQSRLRRSQDRPALELVDPCPERLIGPLQGPRSPPAHVKLSYQGRVREVALDGVDAVRRRGVPVRPAPGDSGRRRGGAPVTREGRRGGSLKLHGRREGGSGGQIVLVGRELLLLLLFDATMLGQRLLVKKQERGEEWEVL